MHAARRWVPVGFAVGILGCCGGPPVVLGDGGDPEIDSGCGMNQIGVAGACVCAPGFGDCDAIAADGCEANVGADAANCGGCGIACAAGATCHLGVCQCTAGRTLCAGACVDRQSDPSNCGACGNACAPGSVCMAGGCICPVGNVYCGTTCADISSDPNDCGACGRACPAGATCSSGGCSCPSGQVDCAGVCADLSIDPMHCGSCANWCPTGSVCASGVCQCPAPRIFCPLFGCTDLSTSVRNCGACGAACDPEWGVCNSGVCGCGVANLTLCGTTCVALDLDPLDCGSCGTACGRTEFCNAGVCSCRPGLTRCGADCVDLLSSDPNCGACGLACTGALGSCSEGTCVTACDPARQDACGPDARSCVDRATEADDPLDCGGCNVVCGPQEVCTASVCEPFDLGLGCTSCPCIECQKRTWTCCPDPYHAGVVICLTSRAPTCPTPR